ncbi:MAG TPA: RNB domain-containing ribonuclease [Polyangia bacterium]|jgi:VacB/RNase II family 3'-5' exoribonuclease|nr:RNB domain-containing ribonuclease [Polyangia bacterium]
MTSMRSDLQRIAHRAMLERGLVPEFSAAEMAEARGLAPGLGAPDPQLRDLRGLRWASIDNDDSRDLDQLTVAQSSAAQTTKILIAIADVDAKVKRGSALDHHARTNTTSVYTDARIFPMLPERLSTDLTSLNEGQERLALVIEMNVDGEGQVTQAELYRAVVVNRAKLAYDAVAAWLEGRADAPARIAAVAGLAENLRLQDRVAQSLRRQRHLHGALELETLQPRAVFQGDAVSDLRVERQNRAQQLIEDFMVAGNVSTARFLEKKGFPSVRRVLRSPERWRRIVELAAPFGAQLPGAPDARALEGFLAERRRADPERFPDLSLAVVKLLGRGEYALETPGQRASEHFGLAVRDYTHSTAPNRRFPDLITQRLVKAALANQPPPYSLGDLAALARHCTDAEDAAAKVERQVRKSAAALLLQPRIGETFEAFVTGASTKGTWVRLLRPPVEGRLVSGFEGLDTGDRITVKLEHTDVERGFIDFSRRGR